MKAILQDRYGAPSVLRLAEVPKPFPKKNELLIKVHAAGVNRTDCANLRAKPFIMRFVNGIFRPRKKIPGTTFAGQIESVGQGVSGYRLKEAVFGINDSGLQSMAEYLTISPDMAIGHIPENCSFLQAAASIEGAHYAINFLNKVSLIEGQTVLVNGATGAIGSAAVQLLTQKGLEVTATCKAKDQTLVRELGAVATIDYETEDFTACGQQFDFVFDTVGKSSFGKCRPLLKPGGAYISSELGWMAQNLFFALVTPFLGGKKVKFPVPLNPKVSVQTISDLMRKGKFTPVIDRTYPLSDTASAFVYVESGKKLGNVVLEIASG